MVTPCSTTTWTGSAGTGACWTNAAGASNDAKVKKHSAVFSMEFLMQQNI
jgi:hypothetical protein